MIVVISWGIITEARLTKYVTQTVFKQTGIIPIPVVMYNLKGYDSHLVMQQIDKISGRISCFLSNSEKYICFSVEQLKFLNSFQFMALSLEKLIDAIDKSDLRITRKIFNEKTNLVLRKGVYPYEYMDSFDRFQATELPPIEKSYSSLTDKSITTDNYYHGQKGWTEFNCKNLGDYVICITKMD